MPRRICLTSMSLLVIAASLGAQERGGSSVTGTIQSQDGSPAAGVRVTAVAAGDTALQAGTLVGSTITDNSGRYRLDDVPPGRYFIAAGLVGSFTYLPGTTDESKATAVSVRAGAPTENLNFKLAASPGVRIRGVVTGLPANLSAEARSQYRVILSGRTLENRGLGGLDSPVQNDGAFELRSVPPGSYALELLPGGWERRLIVGEANLEDIKIPFPVPLTGRVLSDDGSPLSQASLMTIVFSPSDGNGAATFPVARDGTFAFRIAASTYDVLINGLPFGYYVKSIRSGSADLISNRLVMDESPTAAAPEVSVVLTRQRPASEPAGVTVRGRVTVTARTLPANLHVTLTMTPPMYTMQVPVEADGSFQFSNAPAGVYTARLPVPFPAFTPTSVVVGNANVDDVRLVIEASVTLNLRTIVENRDASVPMPTVNVRLSRPNGLSFRSVANSNGTLMVTVLGGTYEISLGVLPARYVLKSITYDSADARAALIVDPSKPPSELVITLHDRESP